MTKVEKNIRVNLECQVTEITDPNTWGDVNTVSLDEAQINEVTAGDEKPFFVEIAAIYEGMSNNNFVYDKDAIQSAVDAMVGVNMYKGHVEPGTQSWKYRDPVGKIVAAKVGEIEVGGKKVLAGIAKAYVTDGDKKLRSDIKKKMAGSVSISGTAKYRRDVKEDKKHVVHFNKPLSSVDFCNPGTGGLTHAGVTAVVSEMAGEDAEIEIQESKDDKMVTKLTKEQLLAEYGSEISGLIGTQLEGQVQEIANSRRTLAEDREKFKDEKKALEGTVNEMKTKLADTEKTAGDWKAKYEKERDLRIAAELGNFVNDQINEMKSSEDFDAKLVDLAAKRIKPSVIDGDLEKSKAQFNKEFKTAYEEVTELSEMFGGSKKVEASEKPTVKRKENPGKKSGKSDAARFMSPELKEKFEKRHAGV